VVFAQMNEVRTRPVSGTLFVVATPLGNLEDLPPRAERVLRSAALVACEDTRRTAKLLARFGIEARTISCHKFNERDRLDPVLKVLREGGDVALVSDGGTPGLSDPGSLLVRAAQEEGLPVSPVPGPTAVAALLSASGFPADRFVFDGFLPHRPGERRRRLAEIARETRTVVVFEAPHRIHQALRDAADVLEGRRVVLGRELTKIHETLLWGTAEEILAALGEGNVRGEIALAIEGAKAEGAPRVSGSTERIRSAWREALSAAKGDRRAALRSAAKTLGIRRDEMARRLAEIGED
jgi:16S rRNA (cytidine1402-2'-O)-methyltransferase